MGEKKVRGGTGIEGGRGKRVWGQLVSVFLVGLEKEGFSRSAKKERFAR